MFKNSVGQRCVIVNQVEDEATVAIAMSFLQTIKEKYPARFEKLLFGSIHNDAWQEPRVAVNKVFKQTADMPSAEV